MNKLQTVYIPIEITEEFWKKFDSGEIPDYEIISCSNGERLDEWVDSKEGYFFTPEELKQLLEEYTNRIVENAKICYISKWSEDKCVDKESITSQLPKFLKEKGI
jgi:hypothetical protein